ncbi:MAG: NADH-quinone oxidoreductase subunit L [Dehalococcoidia bacterium]|nr:NADH-quinone oxidoreductase subunit L [Dehalococcoidia bacterium]MSQ34355.1 NADH-quinone oxidoreductase subunit L [Dehalococcoidia bacterium]
MFNETLAWLILALPVGSFLLNGMVVRPLFGRRAKIAGYLTVAAIAGSFVLSLWALGAVINHNVDDMPAHNWITAGSVVIGFGILIDPLTAVMLVVITGVSLLVQFYSQAYMKTHAPSSAGHGSHAGDSGHGAATGHGHAAGQGASQGGSRLDPGYTRYYSYMSLFTASMIGLVMSRGIVQLFVFWELVGVSSYLLIGFWMERPSAAAAAKKAFVMTRFADFGFLLAIIYISFNNPQWLDIPTLYAAIESGLVAATVATWVGLGLFMGAAGKSAQFPFHSWLPDAMEGPTPVSALIHSATMVTAGVFLVARFFPLYEHAAGAQNTVALVGGFTAVFAASMGLVANDIKRVLAYSTVSQLGYMMFALGVGAYVPAIFHLFTHAWFKAMLFLGSGSVHHGGGTFNMRYLGGLRKQMPWTYWSMVIGSLSLAGLFPLSGFWSKDEILSHAAGAGTGVGTIVLILGFTAAIMTAFYMFRAIFMTFHGEFRGGGAKEREDLERAHQPVPAGLETAHPAESPWVMVAPIVVLAVAAIVIGFVANPFVDTGIVPKHGLAEFLTNNHAVFPSHKAAVEAGAEPVFNFPVAIISSALAVGGIVLAYAMYASKALSPEKIGTRLKPVYSLLVRKYFVDDLYEGIVVNRLFYRRLAFDLDRFDKSWLDNANVQISGFTARLGRSLSLGQNGQMQTYAAVMTIGIVIALAAFVIWGG